MVFNDNLIELLRNVFVAIEVLTAFIATIYFWKYNNGFIKYFLFFLLYIVIHECVVAITDKFNIMDNSYLLSNIYKFIQFTFYLTLYYKTLNKPTFKKINLGFIILFISTYIYFAFKDNLLDNFLNTSEIIGSILITITIVMYFIELLNSDLILKTTKLLMFWITIGLFIYFIPLIPFRVVESYYYNSDVIPYIYLTKYILVFLKNILFIIGFICSQKIQKD